MNISRPARRGLSALLAAVLAAASLTVGPTPAVAADGVDPPFVSVTLGPGGSATVNKTVHTSAVPPNPDLVFLADTTGSMGGSIANVKANVSTIMSSVSTAQPTANFAAAEYKDVNADAIGFRVNQGLTSSQPDVQNGVNQWAASGGGDFPEDGINALFQLATGAVTFRPNGTRIIALFGDAVSHDPSNGHSLADTIAALQAADIRVVAVGVGGGGLNIGGQMEAITNATGGTYLDNVPPNEVAQAILDGIQQIPVTVTPSVLSCGDELSVSFDPGTRTVTSGSDALFTEGIQVDPAAAQGTYFCKVDFLVDGVSRGNIQEITVIVPGLSVNDVTVNEAAGQANFTVTMSNPAPYPVTATFSTSNGSATAPGDYTATSTTVTLNAGETTKQVSVPIVNDPVDELTETFNVTLTNASGAALTDPAGVGTIVDNDRDGTFSCTATALNLAGIKAGVANPADIPCIDDAKTVAQLNVNSGLVKVEVKGLTGTTNLTPDNLVSQPAAGDNARSNARIETTKITVGALVPLVVIEVGVIQSEARATCAVTPGGLYPVFAGSSSIASLKINGVAVTVGTAPLTIPLVVGELRLNATIVDGISVTQQALALDTILTDLVLGEAKANIEGTPANPDGHPCVV
jgi:hypothetical protein